ncbi:hypothetical protein KEJ31_07330 [Candidatus Bathyarchaeota archaeon]|nr:hypothetical protein [Candidatus Bathyarchaeota archaeon]
MALTASSLSIISQYVGGRSYREASQSASRFFTISFLTGFSLCLALLTLKEHIFTQLISTPSEIFSDVIKYSSIMGSGLSRDS